MAVSGLIRGGQLDRRVTILRQGPPTHDGLQNVPGEFAPIGARWASVKPAMGRETVEHFQKDARQPMSIWLRWDALTTSILPTDAIEFDGDRYAIVAPSLEVGRREGIELLVVADIPQIDPEEAP
jgi:head-tail adaptor